MTQQFKMEISHVPYKLEPAITREFLTTKRRRTFLSGNRFTELAVVGGLVVCGAQIRISTSIRNNVLASIHQWYKGSTKIKDQWDRAWFPEVNSSKR